MKWTLKFVGGPLDGQEVQSEGIGRGYEQPYTAEDGQLRTAMYHWSDLDVTPRVAYGYYAGDREAA